MNDHLLANRKAGRKSMRIAVPREEQQLEDQHARRPNGGRAAEKWGELFPQQQLNLEKQKRAEEDGQGKGKVISPASVGPHLGCGGNDFVFPRGRGRNLDGCTTRQTTEGGCFVKRGH